MTRLTVSGTTATVAVVLRGTTLVLGCVGDSSAALLARDDEHAVRDRHLDRRRVDAVQPAAHLEPARRLGEVEAAADARVEHRVAEQREER
mgnify:CR=1 FL=1